MFGTMWSGTDWSDVAGFVVKLAPAASILAGIFAARAQLRNNRRINAEMIAKNHFRKMLREFSREPELLFAAMTDTALDELRNNAPLYRRYGLMYATCMFSLQEIYLAIDLKNEKNWANTIRNFCAIFKPFLRQDGVAFAGNVDPKFLAWARDAVADFDHPFARLPAPSLSELIATDRV